MYNNTYAGRLLWSVWPAAPDWTSVSQVWSNDEVSLHMEAKAKLIFNHKSGMSRRRYEMYLLYILCFTSSLIREYSCDQLKILT